MIPTKDPNSTKYPDRTYYHGQWMTPDQISRDRETSRNRMRRRRASDPEFRKRENEANCKRGRERYATDTWYRLVQQQNNRRNYRARQKEARLAEDEAA